MKISDPLASQFVIQAGKWCIGLHVQTYTYRHSRDIQTNIYRHTHHPHTERHTQVYMHMSLKNLFDHFQFEQCRYTCFSCTSFGIGAYKDTHMHIQRCTSLFKYACICIHVWIHMKVHVCAHTDTHITNPLSNNCLLVSLKNI